MYDQHYFDFLIKVQCGSVVGCYCLCSNAAVDVHVESIPFREACLLYITQLSATGLLLTDSFTTSEE